MGSEPPQITDPPPGPVALGDFNIDRLGDPLYEAFFSRGLSPPKELNEVSRSIFDEPDAGHFCQIAWFTEEHGLPALSLPYTGRAGGFDFFPTLIREMSKNELSWRVSDHSALGRVLAA